MPNHLQGIKEKLKVDRLREGAFPFEVDNCGNRDTGEGIITHNLHPAEENFKNHPKI